MPKISVLVITFNQQDLIGRALESILIQNEYVHEIIICDDCSTDKNWQVILDYTNKYPDLIKPFRNEHNLGIFENIEKCWGLPTGDINYFIDGDDVAGEGWFKTVVEYIQDNNIDYKNELFCIYGDYKCIYPNGDSFIFRNNAIKKKFNPLKLYERGMISNRSSCYSTKVLTKFNKVSQGRSYIAENAQDAQLHLFVENTYYLPFVGNIYYTGIGVSAQMDEDVLKEHEQTMVYAFEYFNRLGVRIDKYDLALPEYNIAVKRMRQHKSLKSIFSVIKCYFKCFDPKVRFQDIQIKKSIFAVIRRFPHSKALHW